MAVFIFTDFSIENSCKQTVFSLIRCRDFRTGSVLFVYHVLKTVSGLRGLTLKAPITTAADDIHKFFFREKKT